MQKEDKIWIEEQLFGAPRDRDEALRDYLVGYVLKKLEEEQGLAIKADETLNQKITIEERGLTETKNAKNDLDERKREED